MSGIVPIATDIATAIQASAAQSAIAQYNLAFQVSPIILQGGIASNAQGGIMPIIALYGQLSLFKTATDPSQFFAQYLPMPGSTLIDQSVATYPFANQFVAANATIQNPLTLSMLMIAPVNSTAGYLSKLATWTGVQSSLQQHNAAGGTYSVATPAFIYNNLLLVKMTHLPTPEGHQQMIEYQLDFVQPLITTQQAAAAQQQLMSRITNGGQIPGVPAWSGNLQGQSQFAAGLTAAQMQFGASNTPNVQSAISAAFGGS